ncbi:MAG TPA: GNAT family N-acetyltransferase, partial [Actinopolymorphaceae bacterium]
MRTEQLWVPASKIPVRRLVHAERPLCQGLAQDQGWNSEDRKWRLLFDIGEVYGAFSPDGELISTATMTRFGPQSVAISMVLTAPRFQGQGLARRVVTEVLARSRPAVVSLYATDEGRPLYEKLGFVTYASNTLYKGRFVADPAYRPRSRPATPNDLPALLALDADVTGADRSNLVTRLFGFTTQLRVLERD